MSMDGQIKWKTGEEPAFNKGGSILADGLLLSVDGKLLIRDQKHLKCLAVAQQSR